MGLYSGEENYQLYQWVEVFLNFIRNVRKVINRRKHGYGKSLEVVWYVKHVQSVELNKP